MQQILSFYLMLTKGILYGYSWYILLNKALQVGGLGVRLTTPPCKKILLRNLKRRPRPTQGCRADDDDDC
jgi:hypothetical protein